MKESFVHRLVGFAIREIEALDSIIGSINPFNFITFVQEGTKLTPVSTAPEARAPRTRAELQEFKSRLLENPLAKNMVLSSDGKALCAIFPVKFQEDYAELLDIVERMRSVLESCFTVYMTGSPIFLEKTKLALLEDVPKFLVLGVVVILAILFLSFRSLRALALPLIVVGLGTLWTMGTMRLLGFPLTVVSIMVPPLVLTLGSAYSIHVLNQYYREAEGKAGRQELDSPVGRTHKPDDPDGRPDHHHRLLQSGIRQPGADQGVRPFDQHRYRLLRRFVTVLLSGRSVPAPTPRVVERDRVLKGPIARFIERLSTWVIRHRYLILATIVLIAVAFGFALRHVSYRTNYLSYYRKKERVVRDSRVLVRRFGGYTNIYLTIEAPGGKNNYFLDPQVLRKISDFENRLSADPDICYIFSFNQYLKLMNLKASGSFTVTEHRAPILLLSRYIKSIVSSPHGQSVDARPINEQFSSLTTTLRAWDGADESLLMEPELKALIARIEELIESELDIEARTVIWGRALAILPAILSMGSGSAAGPGAESRLKVESGG